VFPNADGSIHEMTEPGKTYCALPAADEPS